MLTNTPAFRHISINEVKDTHRYAFEMCLAACGWLCMYMCVCASVNMSIANINDISYL